MWIEEYCRVKWVVLAVLTLVGRPALASWDFAQVRDIAAARASAPYDDRTPALAPSLAGLSYDQMRCIEFVREKAIWYADPLPFRLMMYHKGGALAQGVALSLVQGDQAKPLPFAPDYYLYHQVPVVVSELGTNTDFAGFRVLAPLNGPGRWDELISFLGASYFRALGRGHVYGTSARGLSVNAAYGGPEEFPRFVAFWVHRPEPGSAALDIDALMDSPNVTGAYAFRITPGTDTTIRVRAVLFARRRVSRYGLGALTSMFWHGENSPSRCGDFRPEVHDADGLLVAMSDGSWVWKPLKNEPVLRATEIADSHPRGFGMLQRDRQYLNYQDLEALSHRRPSVWVEPQGDWGEGMVRLAELPSNDEFTDNIVAGWQPATSLVPGHPFEAAWVLHFYTENPAWSPLARVINTYVMGHRVLIDFNGPGLSSDPLEQPQVEIASDNGPIQKLHVTLNTEAGGWRIGFDAPPADPARLVNLRAVVRDPAGRALSETWMYRLTP